MGNRDVTALNILEEESVAQKLEGLEENTPRGNVLQRMFRKTKEKDDHHNISEESEGLVALIDPVTSGRQLAKAIHEQGYGLLYIGTKKSSHVLSLKHADEHVPKAKVLYLKPSVSLEKGADLLLHQIRKICTRKGKTLKAVLPAAETGVELADTLSEKFRVETNGTEFSEARRNKSMMQDAIAAAGLRSIKHKLLYKKEDVKDFYTALGADAKCIVKPNKSSGSDGVTLCTSLEETLQAFETLAEHKNAFGSTNHGVLLEEFLDGGVEYVVDGVSLKGEYKVTAIWRYDKRTANSANFVYFGMTLVDPASEAEKERALELVEYAENVLKALKVVQGPSHMELMFQGGSPCLIEVGSRCHGGDGTWIPVVKSCIGYSQIDATVWSYFDHERFDEMQKMPKLDRAGAEVHLVSFQKGKVVSVPGAKTVKNMKSFVSWSLDAKPVKHLAHTINAFTRPGSVQLVAETPEQLKEDYDEIIHLETFGQIFTVS